MKVENLINEGEKTVIEMFMKRPGHLTGYDLLPDVKPAGGSFNGVREIFRQKTNLENSSKKNCCNKSMPLDWHSNL